MIEDHAAERALRTGNDPTIRAATTDAVRDVVGRNLRAAFRQAEAEGLPRSLKILLRRLRAEAEKRTGERVA